MDGASWRWFAPQFGEGQILTHNLDARRRQPVGPIKLQDFGSTAITVPLYSQAGGDGGPMPVCWRWSGCKSALDATHQLAGVRSLPFGRPPLTLSWLLDSPQVSAR